jgi:hypothetical protein
MTSSDETRHITGTKDKDYNIIWFTEACLTTWCAIEAGACRLAGPVGVGDQRRAARSETSPATAKWVSV